MLEQRQKISRRDSINFVPPRQLTGRRAGRDIGAGRGRETHARQARRGTERRLHFSIARAGRKRRETKRKNLFLFRWSRERVRKKRETAATTTAASFFFFPVLQLLLATLPLSLSLSSFHDDSGETNASRSASQSSIQIGIRKRLLLPLPSLLLTCSFPKKLTKTNIKLSLLYI